MYTVYKNILPIAVTKKNNFVKYSPTAQNMTPGVFFIIYKILDASAMYRRGKKGWIYIFFFEGWKKNIWNLYDHLVINWSHTVKQVHFKNDGANMAWQLYFPTLYLPRRCVAGPGAGINKNFAQPTWQSFLTPVGQLGPTFRVHGACDVYTRELVQNIKEQAKYTLGFMVECLPICPHSTSMVAQSWPKKRFFPGPGSATWVRGPGT